MPQFTFNPFTGNFDAVRNTLDTTDKIYFGTDGNSYFQYDGAYTVNLFIAGILAESWTVATSTPPVGSPIGLLLALTHAT